MHMREYLWILGVPHQQASGVDQPQGPTLRRGGHQCPGNLYRETPVCCLFQ
jgi:hypothetical protein